MKIYTWVNVKDELPPDTSEYFVTRFNGTGSWYEDEVDELQGKDICNSWKDVIKCWLKEIKE